MIDAVSLIEGGTPAVGSPRSHRGRGANTAAKIDPTTLQSSSHSHGPPPLLPIIPGLQARYGGTGWVGVSKEVLYFFGGCDASASPTATLQWCNVVTTEAKVVSFRKGPSARYLHATACDPNQRGRTFTYGGAGTAVVLEDLWQWKDEAWEEIRSNHVAGPGKRHSHQLTTVQNGTALLLVGGVTTHPALAYVNDAVVGNNKAEGTVVEGSGPLCAWFFSLDTALWAPLDTSSQLLGRRLFHLMTLGGRHQQALEQPAWSSRTSSISGDMKQRRRSSVFDHNANTSGVYHHTANVASDTFLCTPGTRSDDVPVVLRFHQGTITETWMESSAPTALEELSHSPAQSLEKGAANADVRNAAFLPPPTRRAGCLSIRYFPLDDDPTNNIARKMMMDEGDATMTVATVSLGGVFESDLSLLSQGQQHANARRLDNVIVMRHFPLPSTSSQEILSGGGGRMSRDVSYCDRDATEEFSDVDDTGTSAVFAASPSSMFLGVPAASSRRGSSRRSSATGIASATAAPTLHIPLPPSQPHAPPVTAQHASISSCTSAVVPWHADMPVASTQATSDAMIAYLTRLAMPVVIDMAGSCFVFGGRNAVDGRACGALMLINKERLFTQVRQAAEGRSAGEPHSPLGRRMSTRLQTIMATLGSNRRKSFYATSERRATVTSAADARESVLQKLQKQAEQEAVVSRRALAAELSQSLITSGEIDPSARAAVEAQLVERMSRTGDGALSWDLHAHYHDLVNTTLAPIGMASPLIADEGIVACETAFYLRQAFGHNRLGHADDDLFDVATPRKPTKATSCNPRGERLDDDAAVDASGRRYREWYHPPNVKRAEVVALRRLVDLPIGKPQSSPRRPASATVPRPPMPLASTQDTRGRQLLTQVRREEAKSAKPSPHCTPCFTPQQGNPASLIAQKYVTPTACMQVNARMSTRHKKYSY